MYNYLMPILFLCLGIAITLLSMPMINSMLESSGLVKENYKNQLIPVGMGISFIPAVVVNAFIFLYFTVDPYQSVKIYILLFGIFSMCFAGIIDDSLGNRDITGLKGHFTSLFKGKLTTAGFKALLGGFIGLMISATLTKSIPNIIVSTLVIALSTNFMNLLDLRPGRALKVYTFFAFIIFIFASAFDKTVMMIIIPSVIAYFHRDIKAMAMMGDAGSNVLGVTLGIFIVMSFNIQIQITCLMLLILVHIVTEKFSLTKIIENNKVLNYIDGLGRD
ncbi:glycosyl transferase [Peptostreptococcus faecalis]|uniref:glycosyl transferase n=1 Tax=Peptostreptococcus faecalis TaxID=2045015 RepID=UPI000C7BB423|nr:glycosyl transferase [Peptostreptococcus faecalis]